MCVEWERKRKKKLEKISSEERRRKEHTHKPKREFVFSISQREKGLFSTFFVATDLVLACSHCGGRAHSESPGDEWLYNGLALGNAAELLARWLTHTFGALQVERRESINLYYRRSHSLCVCRRGSLRF